MSEVDYHAERLMFRQPPWEGDDELLEQRREPQCNRCGSTDVRWRQQTGKWVLFSMKPGVEHVCEIDDDDFDAIPDDEIPPEEQLW